MELRETPFALLSRVACHPKPVRAKGGGAGGIRTLDRALQPYNGLANRRLQPLGHSSVRADMPDTGVSRKRQISSRGIWSGHDSALANGFRKPKPASAAAEARMRLLFDLACALARCRKIAKTLPDKIRFMRRAMRGYTCSRPNHEMHSEPEKYGLLRCRGAPPIIPPRRSRSEM